MSGKIKVGITLGDPAGIGAEITAKILQVRELTKAAELVLIGDRWVLNKFKIKNAKFNFIDLGNVPRKNFSWGKVKAEYGRAALEYLDKAIDLIKKKEIDCLVTCPVSKEAIRKTDSNFSGHTEYLAMRTNSREPVMLLANKYLKIGLVTRHIPLSQVAFSINQSKVYRTIMATYEAMKSLFALQYPRIALCGINPHASEGGAIGNEEKRIILPAVRKAQKIIRYLDGPLPCDTVFLKTKEKIYDAAVALYHDQALIPLKLSDFGSGVNITLGLPFVRTSPLHGTAFDIAGRGFADHSSLLTAVKTAIQCTLNQKKS